MALDIISTQFSVVDAAQEGAMRTSHLNEVLAKLRSLRRCETDATRVAIKPVYIDSRRASAFASGPPGTLGMPWVRVSILKTERRAICGS